MDEHVDRLQELLAEYEEIEADEAAERYDRAALERIVGSDQWPVNRRGGRGRSTPHAGSI
jgi:hypothetical protein